MMEIVANVALILGCAFCAAQLFRQPEQLTEHNKTLAVLITLSVGFIAAAAIGQLLISEQNQDTQTLQRLLSNMKEYVAIPLIGSLLLATSFNKFWSRAGWGRWVLALFALFELFRRAELGGHYAMVLTGFSSAALIIAFVRYSHAEIRLPGLISATLASLAIGVYGPLSLLPEYRNEAISHGLLAISLVILGLATGRIIALCQKQATISPRA
jgi:hypothetical protein